MTTGGPLPTVRRHPFVGLVAGVLLGAGLSLWLVLYNVIALGTWPPLVVPLLVGAAGVAWGRWGPIRGGGAAPPAAVPAYNERVQQALADNESVIKSGGATTQREAPTLLPEIGPPAAEDNVDWHRHDDDGTGPAASD